MIGMVLALAPDTISYQYVVSFHLRTISREHFDKPHKLKLKLLPHAQHRNSAGKNGFPERLSVFSSFANLASEFSLIAKILTAIISSNIRC